MKQRHESTDFSLQKRGEGDTGPSILRCLLSRKLLWIFGENLGRKFETIGELSLRHFSGLTKLPNLFGNETFPANNRT